MKNFKKICRMKQSTLKGYLYRILKKKYPEVVCGDGFIYAKGSDILLTAHMDTVHDETCHRINIVKGNGSTILSSPQGIGGDDRCGIWLIMNVLTKTKYRPSVLFCEDEEIGGVGSNKFVKTQYIDDLNELKFLVELDRANAKDAVFYDCGNEEFKEYITHTFGLTEAYGSFSDIGHLSPACDKASVNISCGYYKQHTLEEYVVFEEMVSTYHTVCELLKDAPNAEMYDYQEEEPWPYGNYYGSKSRWYSNLYDYPIYEVSYND